MPLQKIICWIFKFLKIRSNTFCWIFFFLNRERLWTMGPTAQISLDLIQHDTKLLIKGISHRFYPGSTHYWRYYSVKLWIDVINCRYSIVPPQTTINNNKANHRFLDANSDLVIATNALCYFRSGTALSCRINPPINVIKVHLLFHFFSIQ